MATDSDSSKPAAAQDARAAAPELRLLDRRAFVGFPALEVLPGLRISDFALQIPDVSFPFNVSAGATRYQRKKLHFGFLELSVDADLVTRRVAELAGRLAGIEELRLHFRPGYLEGQGRLPAPERTPFTFKVAFDADGEKLAVYLYDVRLYGFSSTPSVQVPGLLATAVGALGLVPDVEVRGATGFSTRVLPALCQLAAVSRGYKMPALDTARLSAAEVSSTGLRFEHGGKSIGYSTDFHEITDEMAHLFDRVDVWIVDALRARPHPSHSHLAQTLAYVERLKPGRAVLTHMDNSMDYRSLLRELPPHVEPGYDGMEIEL